MRLIKEMSLRQLLRRALKRKSAEELQIELLYRKGLMTGENFNCFSWFGIDASMPWLITIGNDVTISSDVHLLVHDASTNKAHCETKIGQIKIGNNVFVGCGAIILCNTKIGDNVIIGAGSVVTHDIPSNSIAAGSPARVISSFEKWEEKTKKQRQMQPYFNQMPWQDWFNADEENRQEMIRIMEQAEGYGFF